MPGSCYRTTYRKIVFGSPDRLCYVASGFVMITGCPLLQISTSHSWVHCSGSGSWGSVQFRLSRIQIWYNFFWLRILLFFSTTNNYGTNNIILKILYRVTLFQRKYHSYINLFRFKHVIQHCVCFVCITNLQDKCSPDMLKKGKDPDP